MSQHRAETETLEPSPFPPGFAEALETLVHDVLARRLESHIQDIEFRLGRMAELERRLNARLEGDASALMLDVPEGKIYAEDIVSGRHQITGYTLLANSNGSVTTNGSIAWQSVHDVYNGTDYTVTDGTTNLRYTWFVKPAGTYVPGTPVALVSSDTKPTATDLGVGGTLLFVNNGGTPTSVLESSIPAVVADGAVDTNGLMTGAVTDAKIGGVLGATKIPALDASKITSGSFATAQIPTLDAAKITTGSFATAQIPALDASKVTSGAFAAAQIPTLDAAKIGTGTLLDARIPSLDASKVTTGTFSSAAMIPALDASKVTSGAFAAAQIPTLDAAKIGTGTLLDARIPTLDAAKIGTGTLLDARIPTLDAAKIGTGTLLDARIPTLDAAKIATGTLLDARIPALSASKITSGTFASALIGAGTVTAQKLALATHTLY
jgi:hypothetical protein